MALAKGTGSADLPPVQFSHSESRPDSDPDLWSGADHSSKEKSSYNIVKPLERVTNRRSSRGLKV